MQTLADLLERRAVEGLWGRARELARLESFVRGGEPLVLWVHGIAGVGKTKLIDALAARAQRSADGAGIVRVEARVCEPSAASLCRAIGRAMGSEEAGEPAEVASRLSASAERVVLVLDSYESFRLLDAWLRQVFLPMLGQHVRTILVTREPPSAAWRTAPAWQGLFDSLLVEPFAEESALSYLGARGIPPEAAGALNAVACGHPLALALGVALVSAGAAVRPEQAARDQVVDHMAALFLDDAVDGMTRRVAQAACLVRKATMPLLAAMLPDVPVEDALGRLRSLPFVRADAEGLVVHDAVRGPVAAALRAQDPRRYQELRRAATTVLRHQYTNAPRSELWRCTADVLYLIENETLREGFFPRTPAPVVVEPARPEDGEAIRAVAARYDRPVALGVLESWWRHHPEAFFVVRNEHREVVGFYQAIVAARVHRQVLARDPLAARWAKDLPRAEDQGATLWLRRALDRDSGEARSPAQAAIWLDIKRAYLELRPQLRWVYTWFRDPELYRRPLQRLGFRLVHQDESGFDGKGMHTFVLDMGPGSVDGWIGRVLAEEVGTPDEVVDSPLLDEQARELRVDGERIGLTPLEFGVLSYLANRPGKAVARHELIEAVWGYGRDAATSNVVEAVVRSVRRKLGSLRGTLETVRGVGYRYRPVEGEPPRPAR
ncbi:winged helix-turn-helix domain-containing protein [Luteitalea sp.]